MAWSKKQVSILLIISITSFVGTFLISSVNIALPAIEKSFNLNAVEVSWVVTSYLLATAMFLLPVGKWSDLAGAAKIYKIGLIIFTLSSFLCIFAPTGFWFIAFRLIQGVGAAFTNTTGQAILISRFPQQNRGQVIGISVSSVYLGLALGPFAGGVLTQYFGWSSIFILSSALGLISTIIAILYLDKDVVASAPKTKLKGLPFFMLGLALLVYGSSHIPDIAGWLFMITGLVALIIFWKIESNSDNPIIDTKLYLQNKMFTYSNLAALINYCATAAIVFFMSLYLQKVRLLAPQQAGLILIAQPIVMAVFSPFVGRLSDKIQPRYLATTGMAICCTGLGLLSILNENTAYYIIVMILIWLGIGFSLFSSPNMNIIMSSVERSQLGQASGSAASMRVLGQIICMTIVTLLFASLFDGLSIETVSDSLFLKAMRYGFTTFTIIGIIGIYFSLVRGNMRR